MYQSYSLVSLAIFILQSPIHCFSGPPYLVIKTGPVSYTIHHIEMDSISGEHHSNKEIVGQMLEWEDPKAMDPLRTQLNCAIDSIQHSGSFSTFGQIENFVMPGICIDGKLDISLPLMPTVAAEIVEHSPLAPLGTATETLIDINVRHTWQIEPSRITFKNQVWQNRLDTIVEQVAHEIGVSPEKGTVRAEFYKLLIYPTGAMLKSHKEYCSYIYFCSNCRSLLTIDSTQKSDGMCGTLIISLPSEQEGGAVCLHHNGETARYETAVNSRWNGQYLAW